MGSYYFIAIWKKIVNFNFRSVIMIDRKFEERSDLDLEWRLLEEMDRIYFE